MSIARVNAAFDAHERGINEICGKSAAAQQLLGYELTDGKISLREYEKRLQAIQAVRDAALEEVRRANPYWKQSSPAAVAGVV